MIKKYIAGGLIIAATLFLGLTVANAQECTTPAALEASAVEVQAEKLYHLKGAEVGALRQAIAELAGVAEADIVPFDEVQIFYKDEATTILFALYVDGCLKQPAFLPPEQAATILKRYRELKVANGE